jgi:hypothetical protein
VKRPSYSCIQIWSLSSAQRNVSKKKSKAPDFGEMRCEMVLCLDSGPAYDLRWCPLPSHDLVIVFLPLYLFVSDVFCDTSIMKNDNRRSWDCWAEHLKTVLLLYMRFPIHLTWYLLRMISCILFVVYLIIYQVDCRQTHIFVLFSQTTASDSPY